MRVVQIGPFRLFFFLKKEKSSIFSFFVQNFALFFSLKRPFFLALVFSLSLSLSLEKLSFFCLLLFYSL